MDPKIKREWVKALRSGEYRQARKVLCNRSEKMCCLGVLYDVAVNGYWEWSARDKRWEIPEGQFISGSGVSLPDDLRNKLGLQRRHHNYLQQLNDGDQMKLMRRRSFAEIADWIEANL